MMPGANHRISLRLGYGGHVQWLGPGMRRLRRVTALVLVVASCLVMSTHADAARGSARSERERVRREAAKKAAELDVLRAQDKEVTAALRAMNGQVAAQQAALASAQQAVKASEAEVYTAKGEEAAKQQEVTALEQALRDMAVQEFITGGRLRGAESALESTDLSETARRNVLADFVVGSATSVGDQLQAASEDLTLARQRAESAAAAAKQRQAEVDQRLGELSSARDAQASLAARVDDRIESTLAEAAGLAQLDSRLSRQLAAEQAALARANAGRRGGMSGSVTVGNVRLRTVHGITVAESIADNLNRLWNAAADDGIVFGGGGYRNPQQQQRLREAHCPNPRTSPPSSCHPPTARPGHSMHERGLAIDFTVGGRTLTRGSAGFKWLRAHAASYGFYNLPSEAWHWSVNGN
jgi:peptidoglycan hydrolase CwlO-like protein